MNNQIEETIFCLNFEIQTISNAYFYKKSERWVKNFTHLDTERHHIDRYQSTLIHLKDKDVLDIACGCGYGSLMMAVEGKAKSVVGVDLDADSIRYANYRYPHPNIKRISADAIEFKSENKFEVITCFETIEHISNYQALIENLYNLLTDDGVLFISTPINYKTTTVVENPYHVIEWNFFDFHSLFKNLFFIKNIYIQNILVKKKYIYIIDIFNKLLLLLSDLTSKRFKKFIIPAYIRGKSFEKFKNQYNMNYCISGYQVLELKKCFK